MNSAEKKEVDISKGKVKIARTNYVSYMAGEEELIEKAVEAGGKIAADKAAEAATSAAEEAGEAKGRTEEQAMGGGPGAAPQPYAQPPDPRLTAKIANQWANAQTAVEAKKLSLREHSPKAVEILFLILLGVAFYFGASTDSTILRSVLLVVLAFLFVTKQFLFEYLRERIHIPEHVNAGVILNIAIATLIIWLGAPLEWAIVFMIITIILSQYGPWMWGKFKEIREKRKIAKGEKIEKKKLSLDERAKQVMHKSLLMDGIDFLVGLIPFLGDGIGFMLNMMFPIKCIWHRLIGPGAFIKMTLINVVDLIIGAVGDALYWVGNIIDLFPSNVLNQGILKKEIERKKRGLDAKGHGLLLLFLVLLILISGFFFAAPFMANYGGWFGRFGSSGQKMIEGVKQTFRDFHPVDTAKGWYRKQLAIATGDYYTGKVDENAKATLGVYLEAIKQADPVFYTDRPLIMYANLKVQTLDNPIGVTLYCNASGLEGDSPTLFPKNFFEVDTYEEQEIDCMFKEGSVRKGVSTFEIGAQFDFKTLSYLKSYFMESERLRSMRREEIDPLLQYGIKDTKPIAVYTNGPVEIGMGMGTPPTGLDLGELQSAMTLGVTISNNWDGEITKMKKFVLIVPKGFTLQGIGAPFREVSCNYLPQADQALCDDEFNMVYVVNDTSFVEIKKGEFKSYRAYLRVNQADYDKILGLTPIATKYFKVTADYTYKLKKTKVIEVKTRQTAGIAGIVAGAGADMTPPTIENVQSEIVEPAGTVMITWTTDEESIDSFLYINVASTGAAKTTPNEREFSTSHERTITGLGTGKTYQYTITTTDENGNRESKQGTFRS